MQYLTPRFVATDPASSPVSLRLAPRRVLGWVYLARFVISSAIFLAAVLVWQRASRADTLAASLVFAAMMLFTVASALYTEVYRRPIAEAFLYGQILFDLLLVTAIVHVTWQATSSQFATLYILVIAVTALLLPARGVSIVAALGIVLYIADAVLVEHIVLHLAVLLQLVIFGGVALGSGYIAAGLREAGVGREAMAEELTQFRLRQGDVERLHLRAERLEAVAELSAALAHEIKNPLASIRSAVEQLGTSPRTTSDERLLLTLVQRESDRLSRLLTGFLDFAHLDTAQRRSVDIATVAHQAGELAQAHPDTPSGVHIEYDLPRGALSIFGDEDMLHRALFNLALNAVQASPPGGVVRIEATTLLAHQLESYTLMFPHGAAAIRIIDHGAGIPNDVRGKLFHPFFTTRQGGTGLGLAIVHRAIEAHQGVVVVDSDTNGTRFTVLLPRP
jgi:signal transduction histidine kinase